ncbi:MAG: hypothetical protein R2911_23850 [Caldilineaceae bacterium]
MRAGAGWRTPVEMKPDSATHVRLNPQGPFVVDARRAVAIASEGVCRGVRLEE